MVFNFQLLVFIFSLIWLLTLTFLYLRYQSHYNNLTKGVTTKSLTILLNDLLKEMGNARKDIETLKTRCGTIEKEGLLHIQKIGLLRFNPFKDTGGDQSFILSLLDGDDTGVVISGLYSRSGTRWYAKRVVTGKGFDYELSDEEKKALRDAKNITKLSEAKNN